MIFQSPGTSFNPVFTVGDQIGLVASKHLGTGKKETEQPRLGDAAAPSGCRIPRA